MTHTLIPTLIPPNPTFYIGVDAFFSLIGPEEAATFNPVLTRQFEFVKPDKRLLLHVAEKWGVDPSRVLMVRVCACCAHGGALMCSCFVHGAHGYAVVRVAAALKLLYSHC